MAKNRFIGAVGTLLWIISIIMESIRRNGGIDEDFSLVEKDSSLADAIGKLIADAGRKMRNVVRFTLPSTLTSTLTLPSWARGVVEDYEAIFAGKNVELELVEFHNLGEELVIGEKMLRFSLAKTHPSGNRVFEYLVTHQDLIPKEWLKFVLIFPGTVLLGGNSYRYVQCLSFYGVRWIRNDYWLGSPFGSSYRVVGFRK